MKKYLPLIIFLTISLVLLYFFYKPVKYTLVDMCYLFDPGNFGNYKYIQGKLSNPTTINFIGTLKATQTIYKHPSYGSNTYQIFYKICNSKGECVESSNMIYPFDSSNSRSDCLKSCYTYGWTSQCTYSYKTVIPYTCDNLCDYEDLGMLNKIASVPDPNGKYTITITKTRVYVGSNWQDTTYTDFNIYYQVFYDPNQPITTTTTTLSPPPEPILPDPLTWILGKLSAFLSWLRSLLSFQVIQVKQTYLPNEAMQFNITLVQTALDKDYSDGTYQEGYMVWFILDSNGNVVRNSGWINLTSPYTVGTNAPSTVGKYYFVVQSVRFDYQYGVGWSGPVELEKQAVQFDVAYPAPPSPPLPDIFTYIRNALSNLWSWLLSLFGR